MSVPHDNTRDDAARQAHHEQALRIIQPYLIASAGAGLIPIPGIDVTVLAGIHIKLIKALTEHYGQSFSEHGARNVTIAVAASLVPGTLGSIVSRRVLRVLPPGLSTLAQSASSAAVSYALGRVMIAHFEGGGSLDSFDTKDLHKLRWWRTDAQPATPS